MTITEAAACGTPAVATRIAGHADAVVDERTGLLVDDPAELGDGDRPRARRRRVPERRARDAALDHATAVHVGGDRARHARGARRRGDAAPPVVSAQPARSTARRPTSTRSERPRRDDGSGTVAVGRSATPLLALLAYVPAAAHRARARSPPTPSSTSTSIPAGCSCAAACRCGTRTSAWAPSPTRTSATCSRWGRTTGSSTSSASPTGSRSGCGSARSCSSRRPACCTCCARSGCAARASSSPRSRTCSRRTCSTTRRASRCCCCRGPRCRG